MKPTTMSSAKISVHFSSFIKKRSPQLSTASEEEPCHVSAERKGEFLGCVHTCSATGFCPFGSFWKVVRDSAPGENSEDQALAIKTWEVPWDLRQDAAPEKEGMAEDGAPTYPHSPFSPWNC